MIEIIKLTNRNLDTIAQWHFDNLSKTLNRRLNSKALKKYNPVITWLRNNLEEIITAKPERLGILSNKFEDLIRSKRCKTEFSKKILPKIFDYAAFTKNKVQAYGLAKKLNVKTCPYCNRNYTVTIEKVVAKKVTHIVRPDFDHFLAKSKYPLLALSFYNLIPCCSLCNSRIKGDFEMELKKHIHPYVEGFDDSLHFSFNPKDAESLYGLSHNLDITINN